jgi:alpha-mannosidase
MPASNNLRFIFHLLPNAHLDPVWLWDWREGLNEGLITVRTVLNLMDEYPQLTFMRGESAIYQHIQESDPATFKRIIKRVEEGRWDVVGGTVIQPDSNLPSTEVLCREYERGLRYFEKNLGARPTVAWQADTFGHSAGFPNILSAFGMEGFSFTRPQRTEFPMESPAFWWEGDWKNRILCYRQHWPWYCSERGNMAETLDKTLLAAQKFDFLHVGVFMGLGNHGGGPTREHIRDVEAWQQEHPEVEARFSTLHRLFAEVKKEIAARPPGAIPTVRGEFGYCLRGVYSTAQKFKNLYRAGEALIADTEVTRSVISEATGGAVPDLTEAWDALLFNAFHDILPGTSLERALEEQAAWMGGAIHSAKRARFVALNHLMDKIDTTVPAPRDPGVATDVPVVIWNPLPRPFAGLVEADVTVDWRPIWKFENRPEEMPVMVHDHAGNPAPFQVVDTDFYFLPTLPWRRRVVAPVEIPALGWTTLRVGWRDEPEAVAPAPVCHAEQEGITMRISNPEWSVETVDGSVSIRRNGASFFSEQRNIELRVMDDPWGSWGGLEEEKDSLDLEQARETWRMEQSEILERGPLRAKLWTRWKGRNSWLDLTFILAAGVPQLRVAGRMLWNERSARVKLVLPCQGDLEYDVPASRIVRDAAGQVPGSRWVTRSGGGRRVGFASDVLSDFDATAEELRVTLARATRYSDSVRTAPDEHVWRPAVDCGELKFQFCFFGEDSEPDHVADSLLFPPTSVVAPPSPGLWAPQGGLGNLRPNTMRLLSIEQRRPGKLRVRVQNRGHDAAQAVLTLGESSYRLGKLGPQQIKTFTLHKPRKSARKEGAKADTPDIDKYRVKVAKV